MRSFPRGCQDEGKESMRRGERTEKGSERRRRGGGGGGGRTS